MDKHPIIPILEHYGAENVSEYHGWRKLKCPFHGDSTASATVNSEINAFKCFACDMAGDTYTIIMKKEGVEFREAYEIAERLSGVSGVKLSKASASGRGVSNKSGNLGAGRKYIPPRGGRRTSHWS